MIGSATVILLQHAQKERVPVDPPLTALGLQQAQAVVPVLVRRDPRLLVSSPLLRARQTLAPLAERMGGRVPSRVEDAARERMEWAPGVWADVPSFLDDWGDCTEDRDRLPRQGDSSRGAARRLRGLVERLGDEVGPDGVAVVATHGGVTVDLLRDLVGDEVLGDRLVEGMPACGLTTLQVTAEGIEVLAIGVVPKSAG